MHKGKWQTGLLISLGTALMISGCSGGNGGGNTGGNKLEQNEAPAPETTNPEENKGGIPEIAGGRPVTLTVDLHGWMPTINKEPTAENPNVFLSSQKIADEFMKLHPNVKIAWARTKPVGKLQNEIAEWLTTQISAGTAPAITFTWGNNYLDRGWYEPLDDALATPNEYVSGNSKWSELFPDYLMSHRSLVDNDKKPVAIPLVLYSGPATGYYYNKDLFESLGIEPPKDWEQMFTNAKLLKEKGYIPFTQWGNFKQIELGQWNQQFSIGPFFAAALMETTDYNKDGQVDTLETLRAVKAGVFSPVEHEYAQEMYKQLKRMYTDLLPKGWQNTDFGKPWNDGKVAMREEGLWALQAENGNKQRSFEFGVVPAPPVTKATSPHVADVQYTEKGPFQPDPDLSLNILKPIVADNPDLKEAAIAFLKYLTVPENISMMVLEQGASLGAVKGSEIPPLLNDWMNNSFPIMPKASWPNAFTDEQGIALNKQFELWVKGEIDDQTFFAKCNEIQQKSADDYIKKMNVDTTGW
ncbi:ABC transporter substrate-binding protein [Paenibacillus sp. GCM10027626]|uniref:ABC transporter substrate-binding protein n=1 Tax=Paenibacillus sp. GCM10027626 TaxID=3273411 RepID=UPI00362D4021